MFTFRVFFSRRRGCRARSINNTRKRDSFVRYRRAMIVLLSYGVVDADAPETGSCGRESGATTIAAHRRRRRTVVFKGGEKRSFRSPEVLKARQSRQCARRLKNPASTDELLSYRYKVARGLRSRAQLGDAGLGVSRTRVRCATRPRHRAARTPRARPPARHREAGPRDRTGGVRLRGIGVVSDPPAEARARSDDDSSRRVRGSAAERRLAVAARRARGDVVG